METGEIAIYIFLGCLALVYFTFLFFAFRSLNWRSKCNDLTYSQRVEIINAIDETVNNNKLYYDLNKVSYEEHLETLLVGNDPLQLYSPEIRQAWSNYVSKRSNGISG